MNYRKSNTARSFIEIENTKSVIIIGNEWKYKISEKQKCCWLCGENEYNGGGTYGNKAYVLYILTGILERITFIICNFSRIINNFNLD